MKNFVFVIFVNGDSFFFYFNLFFSRQSSKICQHFASLTIDGLLTKPLSDLRPVFTKTASKKLHLTSCMELSMTMYEHKYANIYSDLDRSAI